MPGESNNLFLRLSKWATRQQENFLTEALVVTLQMLIDTEPVAASSLLRALTNGFLMLEPHETRGVVVDTQTVLSCGRPDLVLKLPDCLIDGSRFSVGVTFNEPEIVRFSTWKFAVSKEAAERDCAGQLFESKWPQDTLGPWRWQSILDLSSDHGKFYGLSSEEQLQQLKAFMESSREIALSVGADVGER